MRSFSIIVMVQTIQCKGFGIQFHTIDKGKHFERGGRKAIGANVNDHLQCQPVSEGAFMVTFLFGAFIR